MDDDRADLWCLLKVNGKILDTLVIVGDLPKKAIMGKDGGHAVYVDRDGKVFEYFLTSLEVGVGDIIDTED